VWFHEDTVVPRVFGAIERAFFIVKLKNSNDPRAGRIGGAYVMVAVDDSMRLIKIGRLSHVSGDNNVIATEPGDAVHMWGQQHGASYFRLIVESAILAKYGRDNRCDIGAGESLIFAALREPTVAPTSCAFAFPQDRAALQPVGTNDLVDHVSTIAPFGDWSNEVTGKRRLQHGLKFKLLCFALKLLRFLFAFAPQFFDWLPHVSQQLIFLCRFECRHIQYRRIMRG
jgi:hypothetical protein